MVESYNISCFCRRRKNIQPGGTCNQKVIKRYNKTMDKALAAVTPAVMVSPPMREASTAPKPPGVGAAEPRKLPTKKIRIKSTLEMCTSKAAKLA